MPMRRQDLALENADQESVVEITRKNLKTLQQFHGISVPEALEMVCEMLEKTNVKIIIKD